MEFEIVTMAAAAPLSAVGALGLTTVVDETIDRVFFDLRYNVDTAGRGPRRAAEEDPTGEAYSPTPVRTIRSILAALPGDKRDFVFVDAGSGKGRALLIAAEFDFRRVIGIERSAELNAIARHNLRACRNTNLKCRDVAVVHHDAAAFVFPDDPVVLFLFNPFARDVMERVAENLGRAFEAHPRPVFVVYYHRRWGETLAALSFLERIGLTGANTDYYEVFAAVGA